MEKHLSGSYESERMHTSILSDLSIIGIKIANVLKKRKHGLNSIIEDIECSKSLKRLPIKCLLKLLELSVSSIIEFILSPQGRFNT